MKNFNNKNIESSNHTNVIWRLVIVLICLLAIVLSMYSCDDFVEVELPNSQLTADAVFKDQAVANAAMTEVYAKIRQYGVLTGSTFGLGLQLGIYADELDFYGNESLNLFYNNSIIASNPDIKSLWDTSYNQIYAANAVIEGVDKSVNLSATESAQLEGEALFVRSLIHFYLANVFGDVPYITTTSYELNRKVTRTSVSQVYSLIKADLEQALELLPDDYLNYNRTRPNKYTAHALLARVNLYAGLWDEAINETSTIINNTQLYVYEDLSTMFLKESKSTIWQIDPGYDGGNASEAFTYNFTSTPPPLVALTANLINAFSNNDQRKVLWTKAITDGTSTWYHPFKYKYYSGTSVEYSIIFRLSEMYLIRAESKARLGDLSGAKEDLNKIKTKAGLANTNAITQDEILDAILKERRLELFTEFGHRFFDLKRFNKVQSVLSEIKPGWDASDTLFPIPEAELNLNPNLLPQNPGY